MRSISTSCFVGRSKTKCLGLSELIKKCPNLSIQTNYQNLHIRTFRKLSEHIKSFQNLYEPLNYLELIEIYPKPLKTNPLQTYSNIYNLLQIYQNLFSPISMIFRALAIPANSYLFQPLKTIPT